VDEFPSLFINIYREENKNSLHFFGNIVVELFHRSSIQNRSSTLAQRGKMKTYDCMKYIWIHLQEQKFPLLQSFSFDSCHCSTL
jgi:hypothetical protein